MLYQFIEVASCEISAAVYLFFPTKQSFIRDMELPRLSEWRKLKTHFLDNKK